MKRFLLLVAAVLLCTTALPALAADVPTISKEELRAELGTQEFTILDVRSDSDWDSSNSKIPGAIRLPIDQLETWSENFHKSTPLVLYCACEGLGSSGYVAHMLMEKGFTNVYALSGGWKEWEMSNYPVVPKD